jgi:hypothetical protein
MLGAAGGTLDTSGGAATGSGVVSAGLATGASRRAGNDDKPSVRTGTSVLGAVAGAPGAAEVVGNEVVGIGVMGVTGG